MVAVAEYSTYDNRVVNHMKIDDNQYEDSNIDSSTFLNQS